MAQIREESAPELVKNCNLALHIGFVEFVGIFFEFSEIKLLLGLGLKIDIRQSDVDDELPLQGAAADENREAIAAAVGQRKEDPNVAVIDFDRQMHPIAQLLLAHGAANDHDLVIFAFDDFTVVKRAGRAEK